MVYKISEKMFSINHYFFSFDTLDWLFELMDYFVSISLFIVFKLWFLEEGSVCRNDDVKLC